MKPQLTLMQPTMVVVNAELYCVHSTVEYISTNLQSNELSLTSASREEEDRRVKFDTEDKALLSIENNG